MDKQKLEAKVRQLKSDSESDSSRLAAMREKLTGRSVSGPNGLEEQIADLKKKLSKAAASGKPKIQSEIDALEKEATKLKAEIAQQEEGKATTDKLYSIYSNALQSKK